MAKKRKKNSLGDVQDSVLGAMASPARQEVRRIKAAPKKATAQILTDRAREVRIQGVGSSLPIIKDAGIGILWAESWDLEKSKAAFEVITDAVANLVREDVKPAVSSTAPQVSMWQSSAFAGQGPSARTQVAAPAAPAVVPAPVVQVQRQQRQQKSKAQPVTKATP